MNAVEALGGADWLAENVTVKNVSSWNDPIGALTVGIQQLGLSGWKPEECKAVGNELLSWKERGISEIEGILLSSMIYHACNQECISNPENFWAYPY